MSDVAEYINEMKRLHENARQVDEIIDSIIDMDVSRVLRITSNFVSFD